MIACPALTQKRRWIRFHGFLLPNSADIAPCWAFRSFGKAKQLA